MVVPERIEKAILTLRGHRVILDRDVAAMYGVSTRDLNKAVSRNSDRFPDDSCFNSHARNQNFEVPFWNIKLGRDAQATESLYRARHRHVVRCSSE